MLQSHLAALFAVCTCLSLTADGTWRKAKPSDYVPMQTQQKKKNQEVTLTRELRLIMKCHRNSSDFSIDVISGFCSKSNQSFSSLLCVLSSATKFCYFFDWVKFDPKLGWAPQPLQSLVFAV